MYKADVKAEGKEKTSEKAMLEIDFEGHSWEERTRKIEPSLPPPMLDWCKAWLYSI
jgi:hypothetical protein